MVINAQAMTEVGSGWYKYSYAGYDPTLDYVFVCDGGSGLSGSERFSIGSTGVQGDTAQILTDAVAIKAKTDNLPASPAAVGSAMALTSAYDAAKTAAQPSDIPSANITAIKAKTDNLPSSPAAVSNIPTATAIRTEMDSNSTKLANLDASISSRALASTALSATQWTNDRAALLDRLDAAITSRLASGAYAAPDNASIASILSAVAAIYAAVDTEVAAIKAKTDNLPNAPAAVGSQMTLTSAYDAAKSAASQSSIDSLASTLARVLGLSHENYFLDQTVYAGTKLTSGRMRIYSVGSSVGTNNDVLATYTVTAVWDGDHLLSYKVQKS